MRKLVFGVSDQVRHKPGCTSTKMDRGLESSDLESGRIKLYIANKGTDQLRGYHAANLHRFVSVHAKAGLLMTQHHIYTR